jgi:hypothetical protein
MANSISVAKRRCRSHAGSDVWHFRSDCSSWPDAVYAAEDHSPADGFICSECSELANALDAA